MKSEGRLRAYLHRAEQQRPEPCQPATGPDCGNSARYCWPRWMDLGVTAAGHSCQHLSHSGAPQCIHPPHFSSGDQTMCSEIGCGHRSQRSGARHSLSSMVDIMAEKTYSIRHVRMNTPVCRPVCLWLFQRPPSSGKPARLRNEHRSRRDVSRRANWRLDHLSREGLEYAAVPIWSATLPAIARTCPHRPTSEELRFSQPHRPNLDLWPDSLASEGRPLRTPKPGVAGWNPAGGTIGGAEGALSNLGGAATSRRRLRSLGSRARCGWLLFLSAPDQATARARNSRDRSDRQHLTANDAPEMGETEEPEDEDHDGKGEPARALRDTVFRPRSGSHLAAETGISYGTSRCPYSCSGLE